MAGTLIINESSDWLPASWVFDNAIESLAHIIESDNPDLAAELRDSRTSVSMGYLDLREKDAASMTLLLHAAKRAIEAVTSAGPESFAEPDFFTGYVAQLRRLSDLLAKDPRTAE